jgi:hypothetical protein
MTPLPLGALQAKIRKMMIEGLELVFQTPRRGIPQLKAKRLTKLPTIFSK